PFLCLFRPPPRSTLFPYTTLFRSTVGVTGNPVERFAGPGKRGLRGERIGGHLTDDGQQLRVLSGHHGQPLRVIALAADQGRRPRSEEHTSELQSRGHLVCRLLLEK